MLKYVNYANKDFVKIFYLIIMHIVYTVIHCCNGLVSVDKLAPKLLSKKVISDKILSLNKSNALHPLSNYNEAPVL